jgi:predicted dehydrogenase
MVRVAVVGAGYWGPNFIRVIEELGDSELVAVCDKDPAKLERVSNQYPLVNVTDDFDGLIGRDDLDAVIVATGSEAHYAVAKACLEKGKHVLVEKPISLRSEDAADLIKIARDRERVLLVGHLLRYHSGVIKLKEYIDNKTLGDLLYIYTTRVNLGKVRKEENAMWSFATHDIYVVMYLVGAAPIAVTASGQSYVRKGVHDVVFLTLHFPGDVMAHLHVSWLDPHKIRKTTVVGDKKMAVLDDTAATEKLRIYDKGIDFTPSYGDYGESLSIRIGDISIPKLDMKEPLKVECQHFLDCILKGAEPLTGGEQGHKVIQILEAADQSLREESRAVPIGG